ncbi:polysaccharide transporter, PST family [Desulfuromusa kysingii]|uniref:Polysaccharide transporter, PST family n=1 Tax=Desulfuromusa kysingii TaxID=37625 RepID=A0A1H4BA73_9BACT|nr:lipopolysaccharide biosynthesis protein [Desulfuromusa kysingii]SEA45043.1 polysaccharide transporter, PST family [Desulfuromusa kysingii]
MHKYHHIFDTSHLNSDLKKRSLKSGAVTLTSQGIMFVLQLGSTMVLARILSPEDYGINAMAVAITGFANIFSYLGLSTATIQRAEINHNQVSTLFWINVLIGVFLTIIIAALAPVAAWFYNTPEMVAVMLSLSLVFFMIGLSVQHSALLTRQMRFYSIAKIRIFSMIVGLLVAIVTAYHGAGYWALVFNTLASTTCSTICFWSACRWNPGLPSRNAGVGSMIKFGIDLVGFNIVSYFSTNLDNVLIGRYHGSGALGLYSKAYQLLMLPVTNLRDPMVTVAMPALSRLQADPDHYRSYYMKCVSLLAFISMPIVVFMFVCSDPLITFLLGTQWIGASEIFKILAIAALIQPVVGTLGMVLISKGKSRMNLKLGVVKATVISCSFFFGVPWGAKGVAIAYTISNYLVFLPLLYFSFLDSPIRMLDFFKSVSRPFLASVLMGLVCSLFLLNVVDKNIILVLTLAFIVSAALYIIVFLLTPKGIENLKEYYSYIKLILGRSDKN